MYTITTRTDITLYAIDGSYVAPTEGKYIFKPGEKFLFHVKWDQVGPPAGYDTLVSWFKLERKDLPIVNGNPVGGSTPDGYVTIIDWTKPSKPNHESTHWIRFEVTAPTSRDMAYIYRATSRPEGITPSGTEYSGFNISSAISGFNVYCTYTDPSVRDVKINNGAGSAYAVAGSNVTLSWEGVNGTNNNIVAYRVYRNGVLYNGSVVGNSLVVPSHSSAGASYYYSVQPVGQYSDGGVVNGPSVYSYVACSTPTSISLAKNDVAPGESVALNWSKASGGSQYNAIVGYEVYRSTNIAGPFVLVGSVNSTQTSGTLNVVASSINGETYYFKVLTKGQRLNSAQSSAVAGLKTVFSPPTVSDVKLSKQYAASGEEVVLSWVVGNGVNNPAKSVTIYRDGELYEVNVSGSSRIVPANAIGGGQYQYAVKPVGTHLDGETINAPVLHTYSDPIMPSVVSVNPGSVDAGMVAALAWEGAVAGAKNEIKGYRVLRATSAAGPFVAILDVESVATSGQVNVTAHPSMGGSYFYKVVTIGEHSKSLESVAVAELKSIVYTVVKAPTVIIVDPVQTDMGFPAVLSWSGEEAGTNNPITGFRVFRSTSPDMGYTLLKEVTASPTEVIAHSTMGAMYYYKVETIGTKAGFNLSGLSSVSAMLKTWAFTAVSAPTGVRVSSGLLNPGSTVRISWDEAAGGMNTRVVAYEVYKSTGTTYVLFATVADDVLFVDDVIGPSGTAQLYKIKSIADRAGWDSGFSNVVTVKSNTPPTAPSSVTASPALYESGGITVSFPAAADVDGNLSHYQVQRRIQTEASGWGPWTNHTIELKGLSLVDHPEVERGQRVQYQVKTHDKLGLYSAYTQSIQVLRNSLPPLPVILLPVGERIIYNVKPIIRVSVGAEVNGTAQSLQMAVDSGAFATMRTLPASGGVMPVQVTNALSYGLHTIKVRMMDNLGAVSEVASVEIDIRPTEYARGIEKGSVIANQSISHQSEIEQLYRQVNDIRDYYGYPKIPVPDSVGDHVNVVAGNIGMFAAWGDQMRSLQVAIGETWASSGITPATWLVCKKGMHPSAAVVAQIRREIERA